MLVKYYLPSKAVLRTNSMDLWLGCIRWLFGTQVWELATYDEAGRARSTQRGIPFTRSGFEAWTFKGVDLNVQSLVSSTRVLVVL